MSVRDAAFRFTIPVPVARERRASEPGAIFSRPDPEVAMQVMVEGEWHRPMLSVPGHAAHAHPIETACELVADRRFTTTRSESYEGHLCKRGCFTASELARAASDRQDRERRTTEENQRLDREREEWFATGIRRKDKP